MVMKELTLPKKLQSKKAIQKSVGRYYYTDDSDVAKRLKDAKQRGYMNKDDLMAVAQWKSPRILPVCERNKEEDIKGFSKISFATRSDHARISALQAIEGVRFPMASVILHFVFPDDYPIIDQRVMNCVGGSTTISYSGWRSYVDFCKRTADEFGVSLRELDKALWAYDKTTQ